VQKISEGRATYQKLLNPTRQILIWESMNLLFLIPVVTGLVMLLRWFQRRPILTDRGIGAFYSASHGRNFSQ